ncbi:hypothetical protein L484_013806 [Morus notabilis]|uniref:Uncharacterized protein n=1 Tax=Morus notabilis TaxID=981085 RepID=W9QHW2_9ROSA|nr:hypothetical protein L484_013806 [Morus notabilis]
MKDWDAAIDTRSLVALSVEDERWDEVINFRGIGQKVMGGEDLGWPVTPVGLAGGGRRKVSLATLLTES